MKLRHIALLTTAIASCSEIDSDVAERAFKVPQAVPETSAIEPVKLPSRLMKYPFFKAINGAVQNHTSLQEAKIETYAKHEEAKDRAAWFRPDASMSASQYYSSSSGGLKNSISLDVTQPIWDFGKSAAQVNSLLGEEAVNAAQYRQDQQYVASAMTEFYIRNGELNAKIAILNQRKNELEKQFRELQELFDIGLLTEEERAIARAEIAATQTDITTNDVDKIKNERQWARYTSMPMPNYQPIFKNLLDQYGMTDASRISQRARAANPDIVFAQKVNGQAKAQQEATSQNRLPTLNAVGSAVPNWRSTNIDLRVGLGIDVPLYNADTRSNERQAEYAVAGSAANLLDVERNVFDQINDNWQSIGNQSRLISAYDENADALGEREDALLMQMTEGFATVTELVDAKVAKFDNELDKNQAYYERERAYANLLLLSGWPK